jgi:hypothetical protein
MRVTFPAHLVLLDICSWALVATKFEEVLFDLITLIIFGEELSSSLCICLELPLTFHLLGSNIKFQNLMPIFRLLGRSKESSNSEELCNVF